MKPYRGITKGGKWVKGWYCPAEGKHYIICDKYKKYVDLRDVSFFTSRHDCNFIEVIQETVSQSIDFTDKNNKKMYFDDIIIWNNKKYVIVWNVTCVGVYLEHYDSYLARQKDPKVKKFIQTLLYGRAVHCEIVGTIHDEIIRTIHDKELK